MTILRTLSLSPSAWRLAALMTLLVAVLLLPSIAQAQSPSLTATRNADWSVDLNLSNGPSDWWFRINSWGTCTATSGTTVSNIRGYGAGTHSVWAYSDSNCGSQIAASSFTIPSASVAAVVNDDRSVTITLTGGPTNWWFFINSGGTCTSASGTTVGSIRGYQADIHTLVVYSDSNCQYLIAHTEFTIPTATLASAVNNDRSVTLTLTDGPNNWWFKIGGGTCTAATGSTVSNIGGYQSGSYGVNAYSDSGCNYHIASSSFTIPTATLTATRNADWSVALNLSNGPTNWSFRINSWGACIAATGTTVSDIRGYGAGTHSVWAYSDSNCGSHIASSSFTIPSASVVAVVNDDRSVAITLTGGPSNWWFQINSWGACTAASGTTVSGIRGYQADIYDVFVYSDSSCQYLIAHTEFTIPTATLATTVNSDRSVDLTLTGGPSSWWFRISSWGTCTAASGTTVSGIQGYAAGTYAVGAYSDSGCGYHMAAASFTIPPLPAAPASVVGYRGNRFIDVEWTTVSGATSYDVDYIRPWYGGWTRGASGVTGNSTRITNLPNLGLYRVAVRANNANGSGQWTQSALLQTANYPLEPYTITTARTATTFTVSWTSCDMSEGWCNGFSPVTGYLVEVSSDNGATWTRAHTLTTYTQGQALTISNANASKDYKVRVKIENRMGGEWEYKDAPAPPSAPELFNVTTATSGSTVTDTLKWNKPSDASGAVGYEVQCQYTNDSAWTDCKTVAPTTAANVTTTVTSTTTNKVTALRARADESGSIGAWASPIPDPTGFLAQYQDSELLIWWERPTGAGTAALSYEIDCSTDSGTTYTQCQSDITSPTAGNTFKAKVTTTGITNLRLRWTDGETTVVQHGGWVFTPVPTYTPPGAPTNIQRTQQYVNIQVKYTITWDKPSGETRAVGYEVQCTRANNSAWGSCTTVVGNVDRDLVDATTDSSLTLTAITGPFSELRKVRVRATYELRIASDWTTRTTW